MDFQESSQEAAFRRDVRSFIKQEMPPGLSRWGNGGAMFGGGGGRFLQEGYWQKLRGWLDKLNERGWVAPAWPTEYGGAGLTVIEQFILNQEMATLGAPRSPNVIVLGLAGPTIILYVTAEQKKQHLPPILNADSFLCQVFSAPEAGSALASLHPPPIRDGADSIINCQ